MTTASVDNILIGSLVGGLSLIDLGVLPSENTIHVSMEQAKEFEMFLPKILVHVGIFPTTSEIKRIHQQRINNMKIVDGFSRDIWRTLSVPELTQFKVGKKVFWVIVGE